MGFEGTVRHPVSLNFRLFFGPFLHTVPCGGRPCFGCEALASLLSGFLRACLFGPFSVAFCTPCHCAWVQQGGALAGCALAALAALVLAAGLWLRGPGKVFLVGFEGTVRHPASLNFRLFFGPFLHPAVPLRLGLAEGSLLSGFRRHPPSLNFEGTIFGSFSVPFCTRKLRLGACLTVPSKPTKKTRQGLAAKALQQAQEQL